MTVFATVLASIAAVMPGIQPETHHGPSRPRQPRHRRHHARRLRWSGPALASWYYDAGSTACGFHATYGFASLFLPCGTRVRMRGPSGTVVAVMQDRGPFIPGRTYDLNPTLRAALGCGDLCDVYWQVAR